MRYLLVLSAVGLLAGCGGASRAVTPTGEETVDTINVPVMEKAIKADGNAKMAGLASITEVSCLSDGDDWHYICLMYASDDSATTLKVTCAASGGGTCIWRKEQ